MMTSSTSGADIRYLRSSAAASAIASIAQATIRFPAILAILACRGSDPTRLSLLAHGIEQWLHAVDHCRVSGRHDAELGGRRHVGPPKHRRRDIGNVAGIMCRD